MPIYCYTTSDGETIERVFPMGRAPRAVSVRRAGRRLTATRDYHAEKGQRRSVGDLYPQISMAMGVHANEVERTKQQLAAAGIPTEFDARGNAKLESKQHRRRLMKHLGMVDRDSYTGS